MNRPILKMEELKMKKALSNAFSINMIAAFKDVKVRFEEVSPSDIPADVESQIGHADIAGLLTVMLGRPVQVNRVSSKLELGDVLYVAQYVGPRLPEGAVKLPEGATIRFYQVTLE